MNMRQCVTSWSSVLLEHLSSVAHPLGCSCSDVMQFPRSLSPGTSGVNTSRLFLGDPPTRGINCESQWNPHVDLHLPHQSCCWNGVIPVAAAKAARTDCTVRTGKLKGLQNPEPTPKGPALTSDSFFFWNFSANTCIEPAHTDNYINLPNLCSSLALQQNLKRVRFL